MMFNHKFRPSLLVLAIVAAQNVYSANQVESYDPVNISPTVQRATFSEQQIFKDGTTITLDSHKLTKQLEDANWQNKTSKVGTGVNDAIKKYGNGIKGNEVVVAVIDSGVDINHPDLKNKIWVNKYEIPAIPA